MEGVLNNNHWQQLQYHETRIDCEHMERFVFSKRRKNREN
jgi:hypothetical protein